MADGIRQLAAIQRVEVELGDAFTLERLHLLDRHSRGDESASLRIFIEAVEAMSEPFRHRCTTGSRHALELRKARDRQNARYDRSLNSRTRALVAKSQE